MAGFAFAAGDGDGDGVSAVSPSPLNKAETLIEDKQYEKAAVMLEDIIADSPSADAHNWLGYAYRNMGDYQQSQEHYEKALALNAGHQGALEYYGELHLLMDNPEEAKKLLARLDDVCLFGCEEYDELKEAIEKYSP